MHMITLNITHTHTHTHTHTGCFSVTTLWTLHLFRLSMFERSNPVYAYDNIKHHTHTHTPGASLSQLCGHYTYLDYQCLREVIQSMHMITLNITHTHTHRVLLCHNFVDTTLI